MSYDNPERIQYSIAANNFAGGSTTQAIKGPAGKSGRVKHAHIYDVTITFVGTTSGGQVLVGTAADPNAYFESKASLLAGSLPAVGAALMLENTLTGDPLIPADTDVLITCVPTVGGTITGTASVDVVIDWF